MIRRCWWEPGDCQWMATLHAPDEEGDPLGRRVCVGYGASLETAADDIARVMRAQIRAAAVGVDELRIGGAA